MIASLNGLVLQKSPQSVIVDVNGVGYEVQVSARTFDALPATGATCFLLVQTVVREDAISLYGFGEQEEKELFLLLVTVSGIGPRLALTILSGIAADELVRAIRDKDLLRLTTLPGVGKKTAQRLCMELADKVGGLGDSGGGVPTGSGTAAGGEGQVHSDAVSALVNLGYPQAMAWQAIRAAEQQLPEGSTPPRVEELIRLALRVLAAK